MAQDALLALCTFIFIAMIVLLTIASPTCRSITAGTFIDATILLQLLGTVLLTCEACSRGTAEGIPLAVTAGSFFTSAIWAGERHILLSTSTIPAF